MCGNVIISALSNAFIRRYNDSRNRIYTAPYLDFLIVQPLIAEVARRFLKSDFRVHLMTVHFLSQMVKKNETPKLLCVWF